MTTGSEREEDLSSHYHLVREDHRRLKERLDGIRELTDRCLYVGQETIPTALLDAMLNANTQRKPLLTVDSANTRGGERRFRFSRQQHELAFFSAM